MFRTPALTPADQVVLAGVEALRDRLRHQVQVHPGRLTSGLRRFLTADAVAASNSIEGFHVTTQDVQDLMDGERDVEVSDENREETLAYQRMMTYVQSLHDAGDFAYSKGLLNALHWMLQTLLIAREGVLAPFLLDRGLARTARQHLGVLPATPASRRNLPTRR